MGYEHSQCWPNPLHHSTFPCIMCDLSTTRKNTVSMCLRIHIHYGPYVTQMVSYGCFSCVKESYNAMSGTGDRENLNYGKGKDNTVRCFFFSLWSTGYLEMCCLISKIWGIFHILVVDFLCSYLVIIREDSHNFIFQISQLVLLFKFWFILVNILYALEKNG